MTPKRKPKAPPKPPALTANGKKIGRPQKDIDERQVEQLAAIDCSYAEMAAVLGCDEKTLSNRFSQAIERGRATGKSSLKRQQFKLAMDGNATMLIWLGKVRLGQRETVEHAGEGGGPISVMVTHRVIDPVQQSNN